MRNIILLWQTLTRFFTYAIAMKLHTYTGPPATADNYKAHQDKIGHIEICPSLTNTTGIRQRENNSYR